MEPLQPLVVRKLSKKFQAQEVLKDVHLEIVPGRITGLVGPNGAGKTTLLNILTGRLSFDSAEIHFNNTAHEDFSKLKFSYCPQNNNFDNGLNVLENLRFYLQFRGYSKKAAMERTAELIEMYGLTSFQHTPMKKLSTGMKKKVSVVRAISIPSRFVFFDEPSAGLDAAHRDWLLEILKELKQQGCGVIISSHDLNEIDLLSDELILINQGEIVGSGSSTSLIRSSGFLRALEFIESPETATTLESVASEARVHSYHVEGRKVCLFQSEDYAESFLKKFPLRNFSVRDSNLVDYYYWKTGRVHEL